MIRDFVRGGGYFWRGLTIMSRPRVRFWAMVPIAVSTLVYAGLVTLAYLWFEDVTVWTEGHVPEWLQWLSWVLWLVFWLAAGALVTFTFVIAASLLACPFNGLLAEVVEERLTGRPVPSHPWLRVIKRLPATLWQETKKVLYYVAWAVLFGVLFLIPLTYPVAPFLWGAFSAWMMALELSDYPMDNNDLEFREMRRHLQSRRWLTLGFGTMVFLCAGIPLFNLLVVPAGVCGATAMWVAEHKDRALRAG